jgi:PAS domain S-box-containing protein
MRDHHRPKQDLINEVVALRKQVTDLREAIAARRRVEDALRSSEEQLRELADGSPAGLCLVRLNGTPIAANRRFARMLGYDSPAELLSVADVQGIFATREEQARVFGRVETAAEYSGTVLFLHKNGNRHALWAMGAACRERDAIALVILDQLSAASDADRHSA